LLRWQFLYQVGDAPATGVGVPVGLVVFGSAARTVVDMDPRVPGRYPGLVHEGKPLVVMRLPRALAEFYRGHDRDGFPAHTPLQEQPTRVAVNRNQGFDYTRGRSR
jgi:hypothetical protein